MNKEAVCIDCGMNGPDYSTRCDSCGKHVQDGHRPRATVNVRVDTPPRIEFCHGAGPNGSHIEMLTASHRRAISVEIASAAKLLTKGIRT